MRVPRIFGTRPVILSGIWSLALAGSTACQFPRIEPEASTDSSATDGESTADLCVAEDAFQGTGAWEVALDRTAGGKLGNSCVAVSAPERLFSWKSKADGTYRILAFDPAHVVDPALGYYLDTCDAAPECSMP